jgi:hypothetical protein
VAPLQGRYKHPHWLPIHVEECAAPQPHRLIHSSGHVSLSSVAKTESRGHAPVPWTAGCLRITIRLHYCLNADSFSVVNTSLVLPLTVIRLSISYDVTRQLSLTACRNSNLPNEATCCNACAQAFECNTVGLLALYGMGQDVTACKVDEESGWNMWLESIGFGHIGSRVQAFQMP